MKPFLLAIHCESRFGLRTFGPGSQWPHLQKFLSFLYDGGPEEDRSHLGSSPPSVSVVIVTCPALQGLTAETSEARADAL